MIEGMSQQVERNNNNKINQTLTKNFNKQVDGFEISKFVIVRIYTETEE
jgi:hypothetical protein